MNVKTTFNNLFKDFDFITYPIIIVVGGIFAIFYFPFHIIPDFFDLKNYGQIYELLILVINCLVSLIGICITVSLVAYEFFKQKSGIDFQKTFLINKQNAYFISFSVLTILCSFISSIIISSSNPTYPEVSVVYFNAMLFICVIISLFPVAFNLFSSLRPEKFANEEILKINQETIFIKVSETSDIDEQTKNFEGDSLFIVENIVIALISVKDAIKARAIIQKTTRRLSNLIIDEKDESKKKYITERLIAFQVRIIDF